ncbi:MAG: metX hom [Gemmatimonadetes bacterium]|nr:metX hom [Gemmatimonadota bacterium]
MSSVIGVEATEREAWQAPDVTRVRVALAGCGAVGSALLREIDARRDTLAGRHGIEVELTRVLVRDVSRQRDARFDTALLTSDVGEFLAAEADVVIEAIGGFDPALRISQATLSRSRKLITANKLLLAQHGTALTSLARAHATTVRYDAAVGGGVPILRLLDEALGAGGPSSVRGILNGTANFVLTRLENGASLDEALDEARCAGFAEADASRDLDGRDAGDKIALVAWTAFGVAPEQLSVRRQSLLPEPDRYVALAGRIGRRVRQVAECTIVNGYVIASVEPLLVEAQSALGRTADEGNHVEVFVGWRAPLCASGPGAGGLPTATALLSDLISANAAPRRTRSHHVALADTRRFQWAVEIRGNASALHRAVPNCGLVHTTTDAGTSWTIVEAATPDDVSLIAGRLIGASPIVARCAESIL